MNPVQVSLAGQKQGGEGRNWTWRVNQRRWHSLVAKVCLSELIGRKGREFIL